MTINETRRVSARENNGGSVVPDTRKPSTRRYLCGLLATIVSLSITLGVVPAPSFALSEGRVYEMVSPVYKGGYAAQTIEAVSPNGESVGFKSPGVFAGAPGGPTTDIDYIAHRTPTGWVTTPVMMPTGLAPYTSSYEFSQDLETELVLGNPPMPGGLDNEEGLFQSATVEQFYSHATDLPDSNANWEAVGPALRAVPVTIVNLRQQAVSQDFCHVLFSPAGGLNTFLTHEESGVTAGQIYELNRGCKGEQAGLVRVALNNRQRSISPACKTQVGAEDIFGSGTAGYISSSFNAIADDGKEVFFTVQVPCATGAFQLFVRLNGSKTLEVSKPLAEACSEVPCEPGAAKRATAGFVGASEDGSKVFFMSGQPEEVPGVKDATNNLYMAEIGCPESEPECEVRDRRVLSLVQVSHDPSGAPAEVQGVVRLAHDGSRVYFVARGVLSTGPNVEGNVPIQGADNLYVYEPDPGHAGQFQTVFIADLCSAHLQSGTVEDLRCPGSSADDHLWGVGPPQLAGLDGRFLVFDSSGQLVPGDTDTAEDVYRYDAVMGELTRVSMGENGHDSNGNNDSFNAGIPAGSWGEDGGHLYIRHLYELGTRTVSEDGSRIVFDTAEPLSEEAKNHVDDVYEWHQAPGEQQGKVSLVSSGSALEPITEYTISPDGRNVFFVTSASLAAQDTDGEADVYDARLDGGFAPLGAERRHCESDACQGPLTNPPPQPIPGSASQAPETSQATFSLPPLQGSTSKKALLRCTKGKRRSKGRCVKALGRKVAHKSHQGSSRRSGR